MPKSKFLKIAVNIIIFLVSFFTLCFALEWAFRYNQKGAPRRDNEFDKYYQHDKLLGWAGIPFKAGEFQVEGRVNSIKLNSRGFRDREHGNSDAREDRRRILLLGDSFTWGYGVEFSDIFFERIHKRNPDYEFINTAHCGYGIEQAYLTAGSYAAEYKPDAVLLMFVLNDFAYITQRSAHGYQKPYFTINEKGLELKNVPVPDREEPAGGKTEKKAKFNRKYLYNHSLLFKLFEDAREDLQYRIGIKKADDFYEKSNPKWVVGERILEKIKESCDAHGVKLLIAVVPNKLQLYTFYDSGSPQEMLVEFCRKRSIPCLDMLPFFRDKFEEDREELYFKRDPHWNEAGHMLASQLLENFLETEL